jgi:hypothetical protein
MAKKEEKLLSLNIDNEIREYDANLFSEAANLKVAQMQFADSTILPILSEVTRLVRLGRAIDAEELKKLLPKKYTVKTAENAVKSEPTDKQGDKPSDKS